MYAFHSYRRQVVSRIYRSRITMLMPVVLGFIALLWFLVRVIPKPSRATYPCQRAAFPLASGFVIWLTGLTGSMVIFRRAKHLFRRMRPAMAVFAVSVAATLAVTSLHYAPEPVLRADLPVPPNQPIGVARGLNPGRVTWVHDPDATHWSGPGGGYWWETWNNDQTRINQMMGDAVRWLAGTATETQAWDALFRQFNITHHQQDRGYQSGERITVKINLVGCIDITGWGGCNPSTYDLESMMDYPNTSPQMIVALLHQLVDVAGVAQQDIWIGDTTCLFPNQYYAICTSWYPNVNYFDARGGIPGHPRTSVSSSSTRMYWSTNPGGNPDYIPQCYVDAAYLMNMANLKTHEYNAGITVCGKNHYGSLIRTPGQSGYFDLHPDLPASRPGMGHYRTLVDLMGHDHLGGKTLLYIVDALYAGRHTDETYVPERWNLAPFNNDWTSSVFLSQDPVAVDSVGFDFLLAEYSGLSRGPARSGTEDYLHEAAQAQNPPSGIFYDPNHSGNVQRLVSQGAHEHWNNSSSKQYSRNLDPVSGQGIELVSSEPGPTLPEAPSNLQADYLTATSVQLVWADNADNEDGFQIERKTDGGVYVIIDSLAADVTNYVDTGLLYATTYTYRVCAFNAAGLSDYSNEATPINQVPSQPTGLSTIAGNSLVRLMWTCNPEPDVLYYMVQRSTTSGSGFTTVAVSFGCSIDDHAVQNDTTYYYRISAIDTFGQESIWSGEVSASPQLLPPVSPANLAATPSDAMIQLDWDDNTEADICYYKVYRSMASAGVYEPVATAMGASHITDCQVVNGSTYYYKVTAVNDDGLESGYSNMVYGSPQVAGAPAAPSNLTAQSNGVRQIALTWQDNADDELGFRVDRDSGMGFEMVQLLGADSTTWADTGLIGGGTYTYRVIAWNNTGDSQPSNTDSAVALPEYIHVDDADASVSYSTGWVAQAGLSGRTNGTTHETMSADADVSFTFTGIGIQLIAEKQTWGGTADVFIDDILYTTVDFSADPGQQYQQIIYTNQNLTFSEHTIRIENNSENWIYVDEFIYMIP